MGKRCNMLNPVMNVADHSRIGFVIIVKDMITKKYTMREIEMEFVVKLRPQSFLELFFDVRFLRISFNTGMLGGIKYECPDLKEEDVQRFKGKALKYLRNEFGIEENPSRRF